MSQSNRTQGQRPPDTGDAADKIKAREDIDRIVRETDEYRTRLSSSDGISDSCIYNLVARAYEIGYHASQNKVYADALSKKLKDQGATVRRRSPHSMLATKVIFQDYKPKMQSYYATALACGLRNKTQVMDFELSLKAEAAIAKLVKEERRARKIDKGGVVDNEEPCAVRALELLKPVGTITFNNDTIPPEDDGLVLALIRVKDHNTGDVFEVLYDRTKELASVVKSLLLKEQGPKDKPLSLNYASRLFPVA